MSRTDEQKAADANLVAAVAAARAAYLEPGEAPDIMTDFLVVVAATRFEGDGEETAVYDLLFRDGAIRDHAAYGLLKVAERLLIRMEDGEGV